LRRQQARNFFQPGHSFIPPEARASFLIDHFSITGRQRRPISRRVAKPAFDVVAVISRSSLVALAAPVREISRADTVVDGGH
jgi:hypothetical protein